MLFRTTVISAAAVAMIAPASAAQGTATGAEQNDPQRAQASARQLSPEARDCIDKLEQHNERLGAVGYGRAGPQGYGMYGVPYGRTIRPAGATPGASVWQGSTATPRSDLYTLMRAGYVLAVTDHVAACQSVVRAVADIENRYMKSVEAGEIDTEWRKEFLTASVPTSKLEGPVRTDRILGADVRNLQDEDLGDVEDVILDGDGEVRYVVVSSGGFLGIGDENVPVRWTDLRITRDPYDDTLVLDVDEATFQQAPRLDDDSLAALREKGTADDIDRYWTDAGLGSR